MKAIVKVFCLGFVMLLMSCKKEPTLQKYFVEKSENKAFTVFDLSPNILNLETSKLSASEKKVFESFEKVNVLTFKADKNNQAAFETERKAIASLLKDKKYESLIRVSSGKDAAEFKCVGKEEKIDEFILYGNRSENGLAVVRITGEDMNPNTVFEMLKLMQKSKIDIEQLKPLQELFK